MNEPLFYFDRISGNKLQEKVYFGFALDFLYTTKLGKFFSLFISKISFFSKFYGLLQKTSFSKRKILPFIEKYEVDLTDFEKKPEEFESFNDFFIRKLKPEARQLAEQTIIPADGRYLFFQNMATSSGFFVKGKKFSLTNLLQDAELSNRFRNGSLAIARLCPTDYHRFHFPCDCTPGAAKLINGPLFSVNPVALKRNIEILAENKRMITELQTKEQGTVLFIEVGATNVGSISQTYLPGHPVKKGAEKGYFSFGGSSILLLFEKGAITFQKSLIENSEKRIETLCKFGQSFQ